MHRVTHRLLTLVVALAMLAAGLVAAGSADARPNYRRMSATETSFAGSILSVLNRERAAHGLKPVRMSTSLRRGAIGHNQAMARVNVISHQLRGEKFFAKRMRAAGWKPRCAAAENVGVNGDMSRAGAVQLQTLMYNEVAPNDGHRRNILGARYTHVGIAVLIDSVHHRVWLTVDFAQRRC